MSGKRGSMLAERLHSAVRSSHYDSWPLASNGGRYGGAQLADPRLALVSEDKAITRVQDRHCLHDSSSGADPQPAANVGRRWRLR